MVSALPLLGVKLQVRGGWSADRAMRCCQEVQECQEVHPDTRPVSTHAIGAGETRHGRGGRGRQWRVSGGREKRNRGHEDTVTTDQSQSAKRLERAEH